MVPVTCLQLSYGRVLAAEAIESFLRQTYQEKELFIVNTHPLPLVLDKEYDNIRVFNVSGFSHLSNVVRFAISLVRTPVYCFWHDDDIFLPWHLEQRLSFYNGQSVAVGHRYGLVAVQNRLTSMDSNLFVSQHLFCNNGALPKFNCSCWDAEFLSRWKALTIPYGPNTVPSYIFRWETGENHIGAGANEYEQHAIYLDNIKSKASLRFNEVSPLWSKDYVLEAEQFLARCPIEFDPDVSSTESFQSPSQISIPIQSADRSSDEPLASPDLVINALTLDIDTSEVSHDLYRDYVSLLFDIPLVFEVDYNKIGLHQLKRKKPLVSVILVARNEDEWLRKCIESLHQTKNETPFEIILLDDGSTDLSVTDFAVDYAYRSNGLGPSRARNQAASFSNGKILIFCDAHLKFQDYWIDNLIAPILDGRVDAINPVISDIAVPSTLGYSWSFDLNSYEYKWDEPTAVFRYQNGLAGGCLAIKWDTFNAVGKFDPHFVRWGMEDSELSLRLALSGYKLGLEPSVVVGHFFKETNDYSVDWLSYNFNFLRMAYVNMDSAGLTAVFNLVPGSVQTKKVLLDYVIAASKERKAFADSIRKQSFAEFVALLKNRG